MKSIIKSSTCFLKVIATSMLFFISHLGIAQKWPLIRPYKPFDSTFTIRKNVIKINPIPLAISIGFQKAKIYEAAYERVLNRKHTVSLAIIAGDITYIENSEYDPVTRDLYLEEVYKNTGIVIRPQYRYYFLNRKNRFPRGYYTGAFPFYLHENDYYELRSPDQQIIKSVRAKNNCFGLGALLGWQEMFKNGITFNIGAGVYYMYNTNQ
jgi:hypothetical protein